MSPKNLEALLGIAAQGMIQHGVGNRAIDQQIGSCHSSFACSKSTAPHFQFKLTHITSIKCAALGYLQVNTGNFENAIRVFNQLLQVNPKVVAAYLGRGTAYALMGDLDNAARDFSLAIDIDPKCVDAYKRRGQTRAARGMDQDGLADLNMALEMQKDHESYHQRGLIHYKLVCVWYQSMSVLPPLFNVSPPCFFREITSAPWKTSKMLPSWIIATKLLGTTWVYVTTPWETVPLPSRLI
jgi:tetratricopeptide (TPR) repeat protein